MDKKPTDEYINNITISKDSTYYLKESLGELFLWKENRLILIISMSFSFILSLWLSVSRDTIILTTKVCDTILNLNLALFACFFTAFSLIFTFLTDDMIKFLYHIKIINKTQEKTDYFYEMMCYYRIAAFAYFLAIIISFFVKLILNVLPEDFVLCKNNLFNIILSTILLFMYFAFSFRIVLEFKSTIYNTILLLSGNKCDRFIALLEKDKENDKDK